MQSVKAAVTPFSR